ncbi:hypothetical protein [Gordonia sp. SND2]|uniref:hypothetical protein n=1 Tax=Gordonia sp. SND2 TaxID=3388659 RepID=UPI00398AFD68
MTTSTVSMWRSTSSRRTRDVSEKLFALVEESLDTYFGWMLGYSPSSDRGAGWLRPLLEAYERADREDSQA